ncbi:integrating conjugative element protein [Chromatiales bacterium (ex Bugula neritina AB1)]|nr:integrating conjugative element protein [Chromatiales bacterium (ex Bugula neritina AB1)]
MRTLILTILLCVSISASAQQRRLANPDATPWFTIPDLSILANSIAITSLVGKVYLDNDIVNPRLFKVLVGRENLTANFHELPLEIEGMIFEGFATGEFTTRCVYGDLIAATFIFTDGSVQSFYPGDPGTRPQRNAEPMRRLGYISDPYGNPCVSGRLITDAPEYLGSSFLLSGAAAYARALKLAETQSRDRFNRDGDLIGTDRVLTGDVNRFAAASALSGAADKTTEWLDQRYRISTDVIYAPAGQRVDLHIQQELRLDKRPSQRQVRYSHRAKHQPDLD